MDSRLERCWLLDTAERDDGVGLDSVLGVRCRPNTMGTMKIPSKAIAMLMSGELSRWLDLDANDLSNSGIGRLYQRVGVEMGQGYAGGLGIPASTWRAAQLQTSPYTDRKTCSYGHAWCVPFGGFHLVVVEDEDE